MQVSSEFDISNGVPEVHADFNAFHIIGS